MKALRKKIDSIDHKILALLAQRFVVTRQIGVYKKKNGVALLDTAREREVETQLAAQAKIHGLDPSFANKLWKHIFRESRRIQNLKS